MGFCCARKVSTTATGQDTLERGTFRGARVWQLPAASTEEARRDNVVVVVANGDAAFTCGTSYEALNNVADNTKRLIVVLNDNEWSIAKNVGAIANYLNKLVTNDAYSHLHEKAAKFVSGSVGTGSHNNSFTRSKRALNTSFCQA